VKNLGARRDNLDQDAYLIIKNMIIDRKLFPGEKIIQEKLAQNLGISRTPLVNALKYLEKEKLIESKPRRGFFVRLFSKEELISIFELREVLEGLAARRAAQSINDVMIKQLRSFFKNYVRVKDIKNFKEYVREDRRFHNFIIEIGSKEFLKGILVTYNVISFSYQLVAQEGLVRPPNETIHEHLAVINAICEHDSEEAEKLMRTHFQKSAAFLRQN